ncbi:glycoside hydrolase family 1 protein [Microlunatus sp. Y2014]|uniref:glycoside hydrolase family 1 protein n=1 Tax=Microlunatus sp. Y2014 TaxID=3418488 RepID=UPI003DA78098
MTGFSLGDLALGVSTAATQIEGGDRNNNWYDWAQRGHIKDRSSPDTAGNHWEVWASDIELLDELGIRHYRMSIEWSRLEPLQGQHDPVALQHYRAELTELRRRGIRPLVTLHHFSHPSWFESIGGFEHADGVTHFLRHVRYVVTELADLVQDWITINEPNVYVTGSYFTGLWPPGTHNWASVVRVFNRLATAHILAYELIHELQPDATVGVAFHLRTFKPALPWSPWHLGLARMLQYLFQEVIAEAMCTGVFPYPLKRPRGISPGKYYDVVGINYYTQSTITRFDDGTAEGVPVNDLGWEIMPAGLVQVARWANRNFPGPIWITENGTCDNHDRFRSRYIHDHLRAIVESELPIERYYHWCFIDNWEWDEGSVPRFGLVHLDHASKARTIKESGRFFAEIIANRGVTETMYDRWVRHQYYPKTEWHLSRNPRL